VYGLGPERRKLKIKDPQRYSWNPKEVLAQIAAIYVNLSRADAGGVFAREIAADERCYREAMFPEAAQVTPALAANPAMQLRTHTDAAAALLCTNRTSPATGLAQVCRQSPAEAMATGLGSGSCLSSRHEQYVWQQCLSSPDISLGFWEATL
jgi:hypothetical protein